MRIWAVLSIERPSQERKGIHGKRDFLEIPASTRPYYARPAEVGGQSPPSPLPGSGGITLGQTPLRQLEEQDGAEAARF